MNRTSSTRWSRTTLAPIEREALIRALTSQQTAQLDERGYVWVAGTGVLWKAPDGALRRARFTHGTYFRTQRGEFYIDSEGSARAVSNHGQVRCEASQQRDGRSPRRPSEIQP